MYCFAVFRAMMVLAFKKSLSSLIHREQEHPTFKVCLIRVFLISCYLIQEKHSHRFGMKKIAMSRKVTKLYIRRI